MFFSVACQGVIDDPMFDPTNDSTYDEPVTCADPSEVVLGTAPVRRLTNVEYDNTVRDLFGGAMPELPVQPSDAVAAGTFENNARTLGPSDVRVQRWEAAAMLLGQHAVEDPIARSQVVPCETTDAACGAEMVRHFGRRAFRRPLTPEQERRFTNFFEEQRMSIDFDAAVQLTVAAMLQSPQFLYRLELSDGSGDSIPLDGYEMASRLSYFLWESMPDEELLAAAEADELQTDAQIEAQVRRMLADPRARAMVRNFHRQWLYLDRVAGENKTADYPLWNERVRLSAREASQRFAEEVVFGGGGLRALLTSNVAFIDEDLAAIYEVEPPSEPFGRVELDPATRGGILSRVAFLAGNAHEANGSPPLRGVFVMERLLCEPRPSPPANANTSPPRAEPGEGPFTNRQLFEQRTEPASCRACHNRIDGFGFGFENYDTIGAFRTEDNGLPVDASGYVSGIGNDGAYVGAVELQQLLAESETVHRCVAQKWLSYAQGRGIEPEDACLLEGISRDFLASGGDIEELLVRILLRPEMRLRPARATEASE